MERTRILVWDLPVRVFHWLLALSFAGAFLSAESERLRDLHIALGYTFAGLIAFRLVWGVIGSRYARFASFMHGPRAVLRYLASLVSRSPDHHVGHNPAGGWAIVALLALGALVAATGYATYTDVAGHFMESLHEGAANTLLALVVVHIVAVVASSVAHRENLVAAMITGYKRGRPDDGLARVGWAPAVAIAGGVIALWVALFSGSEGPVTGSAQGVESHRTHELQRHERAGET